MRVSELRERESWTLEINKKKKISGVKGEKKKMKKKKKYCNNNNNNNKRFPNGVSD